MIAPNDSLMMMPLRIIIVKRPTHICTTRWDVLSLVSRLAAVAFRFGYTLRVYRLSRLVALVRVVALFACFPPSSPFLQSRAKVARDKHGRPAVGPSSWLDIASMLKCAFVFGPQAMILIMMFGAYLVAGRKGGPKLAFL